MKMRKAQFVLSGGDRSKVKMYYLIEGKLNASNTTDGKWVGKDSYDVTTDNWNDAVISLGDEGFEVIRSDAMMHVERIVEMMKEIAVSRPNDFLPQYKYDDFKRKLKDTDDKEGEPPQRTAPTMTPPTGGTPRNPYEASERSERAVRTPAGAPWDPSNTRRGNHRAICERSERFECSFPASRSRSRQNIFSMRSLRSKFVPMVARCSNIRRGNYTAFSNCTPCNRHSSRRVAMHCLCRSEACCHALF